MPKIEIRHELEDEYPHVVYSYNEGDITAPDHFKEDKDLVDALAPGGPEDPPQIKHPGFYKGDDFMEWAKNEVALLQYNGAMLRQSEPLKPVQQQMLDANDRKLGFMAALVKKAGG